MRNIDSATIHTIMLPIHYILSHFFYNHFSYIVVLYNYVIVNIGTRLFVNLYNMQTTEYFIDRTLKTYIVIFSQIRRHLFKHLLYVYTYI